MHPAIVSNEPGQCPSCGMDLVRIKAELTEATSERPVVQISPVIVHNLGVRTAPVVRATLVRKIEIPGFIQQIQPGKPSIIRAPAAGRVERLPVGVRQWVEAGELLLQWRPLDPPLESHPVRAPHAGWVMEVRVSEGSAFGQGDELIQLLGPARASVVATAFQRDVAWIQPGQPAEVYLPQMTGKAWPGVVNRGEGSVGFATQNIGLRLSFDVPQHLVRHAMYVRAKIQGETKQNVLAVPEEALIRLEHETRIIVALGQGRFKPVPVQTGLESDGLVEILSGIEEGDQVVVSAQFLIDSESNLQASLRRLGED
jgi:Cu(I)/Ag(I) efflux system membrane fusion protein